MKKLVIFPLLAVLLVVFMAACSEKPAEPTQGEKETEQETPTATVEATKEPTAEPTPEPEVFVPKAVLITDSGAVDDGRFNEDAWTGLSRAADELGYECEFFEPESGELHVLLNAVDSLYAQGFNVFVLPGGMFGSVVYEAQDKYEDARFIIIDAAPNPNDIEQTIISENTVSVQFKVHESGFLAGAAAALYLKQGDIGFIGGMPMPSVQHYNWGFQQGVTYANENLSANCTMKPENWIYQGTFFDSEAGKNLAAQMYGGGVKVIFCVAGPVGRGAFEEAMTRAAEGESVFAIGSDFDQYPMGIYEQNKSIILTSAKKSYSEAAYMMLMSLSDGDFPGGKAIFLSGGLPEENPNLSQETVTEVLALKEKIKSGEIIVSKDQDGLLP